MLHLEVITNDRCGCCHDFLHTLEEYKRIHSEVDFSETDIEKHLDRDIKGLPYTIVYKNNVEVGVLVGNMRMDILDMQLQRFSK